MRIRAIFFAVCACLFWGSAGQAQEVLPPEPGIEGTITAQIDAFLRDDFAKAFTYASPNIQGMFGNSERFGQMVQRGYPMVWRPADVEYQDLREIAGNLWQRVKIQDQSGRFHYLDYQMIETGDGWRINGVQLLRMPDVSA